jgi:uncharacterized alkaline shock family protein YloU
MDELVLHEQSGSIAVTPQALTRLVVRAAESVEGARVRRPRRGLAVIVAGGRASVSLALAAPYGSVLPELAREVQERVAAALAKMCDVEVEAVDVAVEELDEP